MKVGSTMRGMMVSFQSSMVTLLPIQIRIVAMPIGADRKMPKCYHYSNCYHHFRSEDYSVFRNSDLCQRLRCLMKSVIVNGDCSCT